MTPPCGHPDSAPKVAGCVYCLIRDVDYWRVRWSGGAPVPAFPVTTPRPPCLHLGARMNVPGQQREHFECGRGHGVVCPCRECRTCPDYAAGGAD